jgi:type I restriction enzyme S subunit
MSTDIKLPKDWELKTLGEVCNIQTGKYDANHAKENGKYRFYTCAFEYIYCDTNRFSGESIILPGNGANVGEVFYYNGEFDAYQRTYVLNEIKTYSKYLYYHLQGNWKRINLDKQFGSATNYIRMGNFTDYVLPVPPLSTQQAIVSKIEELFSELDNGITNLKTAQLQLKTYRQSVLNLLVTGENCMPIENVIAKLDQGWSPKCHNEASTDKTEWAVIKTSAVQQGHFIEIQNKRLPKNLKPRTQHELQVGDILITRAGPRVRVGICCMIKNTRPKLINCDKVYRIKVNRKIITPEYFEFILNTPQYQDEIEKMKSGISDSGLNLTQKVFLQITIPIPTLKEQYKIVQEIESRLSVADKLEESITQSLQQAEALRQSILKKAFEGKLV